MDSNNLALVWEIAGPGVAGAIFGAGWWFWVDAVVCSAVKIQSQTPPFPTGFGVRLVRSHGRACNLEVLRGFGASGVKQRSRTMGKGDPATPAKAPKAPAAAQELPSPLATSPSPVPSTGIYPDWPGWVAPCRLR